MPRCFFILSLKSSGSSIVQQALTRHLGARMLEHTPHHENETLYFLKGAAALGLPQIRMENSEVPYSKARGARMLREMVQANLPSWSRPLVREQDMFAAWSALVQSGPGDFVEKSPHHLYQPSALSLMERYADSARSIDVRFIGLVRNPIATLYSSWKRFGVRPEREEWHWLRAYRDLLYLKGRRPRAVTIVRYEDLVSGRSNLSTILGEGRNILNRDAFNEDSLAKWRSDRSFGYRPAPEVAALARVYGYTPEQLATPHARPWSLRREPRAVGWTLYSKLPPSGQRRLKELVKAIRR